MTLLEIGYTERVIISSEVILHIYVLRAPGKQQIIDKVKVERMRQQNNKAVRETSRCVVCVYAYITGVSEP